MFNTKRTYPEPESLNKQKKIISGKYNLKDVLDELIKIFYNKCYLCEEKYISSINVEHLISHQGNINLKFDWENLFLGCSHCNNQKNDKFDDILDCTKDDVVNSMKYELPTRFPKAKVKIVAVNTDKKTKETVKLLNLIYEGKTATKDKESANIKIKVMFEIDRFETLLNKISDINNIPIDLQKELKESLSKESPFSAFKRWIVKNNKKYSSLESIFD